MRRHQGAKDAHFDISNVIYHKFSHGGVSYTLNGENVNVMLESVDNVMSYQELCWAGQYTPVGVSSIKGNTTLKGRSLKL